MFSWKAALPLRSPSLLFIVQLRNHQALVKHDPARAGLCPPSATGAPNMVFKIFWSFEPRYHGNDIKKNRSLDPLENCVAEVSHWSAFSRKLLGELDPPVCEPVWKTWAADEYWVLMNPSCLPALMSYLYLQAISIIDMEWSTQKCSRWSWYDMMLPCLPLATVMAKVFWMKGLPFTHIASSKFVTKQSLALRNLQYIDQWSFWNHLPFHPQSSPGARLSSQRGWNLHWGGTAPAIENIMKNLRISHDFHVGWERTCSIVHPRLVINQSLAAWRPHENPSNTMGQWARLSECSWNFPWRCKLVQCLHSQKIFDKGPQFRSSRGKKKTASKSAYPTHHRLLRSGDVWSLTAATQSMDKVHKDKVLPQCNMTHKNTQNSLGIWNGKVKTSMKSSIWFTGNCTFGLQNDSGSNAQDWFFLHITYMSCRIYHIWYSYIM